MTDTLSGAPWLVMPETKAVVAALEAVRPGCVRFVGGCVRNTVMARAVDDIDLATQLTPDAVIAALETAGIRAIPTGIEHGTVTAVQNHIPFEITTLRRDVETDGRRAVVAFTEDWAEDAQRRDFRLNALYADPDGTLYDLTGGGLEDARAGRVMLIGDADERLREDYLRILRFFRFNAWYGAGIDAEGLAACARQKAGLEQIAAERKWKELKKLLAARSVASVLGAMEDTGVLETVLPGARADNLAALEAVEANAAVSPDPMQRLMTLIPRRVRDASDLGQQLRLSNAEAGRLMAWAAPSLPSVVALSGKDLRAQLYLHGVEAVTDRAVVEAAGGGAPDALQAILVETAKWERPTFPLSGNDALAAGLTGSAVGDALRAAEQAWVESDFTLDRAALLALI